MHIYKDIDFDLQLLADSVRIVDERLSGLDSDLDRSFDPDSEGILDRVDYFSGFGFVACQVYITAHVNHAGIPKRKAIEIGPRHRCKEFMAALVDAAANQWKHQAEWSFDFAADSWNFAELRADTKRTIERLKRLGLDPRPGRYSIANALYELTSPHPTRFESLLPFLQRWRDELCPEKPGDA